MCPFAGLLEYEQLLHEMHIQELNFDVIVLRVDNTEECYRRLTKIYNEEPGNIRVLLHLEPVDSQAVMFRLVSIDVELVFYVFTSDFNIIENDNLMPLILKCPIWRQNIPLSIKYAVERLNMKRNNFKPCQNG